MNTDWLGVFFLGWIFLFTTLHSMYGWNLCQHLYTLLCLALSHIMQKSIQAPVPLSIFRSNSKFDENSKHSSVYVADHNDILHTSRQCHCRDVCKISLWSVEYIWNYSVLNFHRISNSIEICLVGRAPGVISEQHKHIHWIIYSTVMNQICISVQLR